MRKSVHTPEYSAMRAELRAARESAGLSQREVAAALRVPHSVVAKMESGERRVDLVEFCWFLRSCGADAVAAVSRVQRKMTRRGGGA